MQIIFQTSYSRSVQLVSTITSSFLGNLFFLFYQITYCSINQNIHLGTFLVNIFSVVSSFWASIVPLSIALILSFFIVPVSSSASGVKV